MAHIYMAMSGGVDSSVGAALLLEQGHQVTGLTMQLWPQGDEAGQCCGQTAVRDARGVCDRLGIPHYALNFREEFEAGVVQPFAESYALGRTPNPCIACNDRVKFRTLLRKALLLGGDALATGHYARLLLEPAGPVLARAADKNKDQSYFLYRLTREQASHVLFPLSELTKQEVRAHARRLGLSVASKPESQDICFAVNGSYDRVLRERVPGALEHGEIVDTSGLVVGTHTGVAHYTIGQRQGLGIGGLSEPAYVLSIDVQANRLTVGPRSALRVSTLRASDFVWHGNTNERVVACVRYRMEPVSAVATVEAGVLAVTFETPVEGVALGQSVVCYRDDVVMGGGIIECAS